jgi:signal transduction histidine kinase
MEQRSFIRFQTKLALTLSGLAVLIASFLVLTLYTHFRTQLRQDLRQRLGNIVAIAALSVDGDAHATLVDPGQEGNATYTRIKQALQRIRDHATDVRFAYTWRRNPDGQLIFIVDAETDPNEVSHLGDVYDSGDPALLAKLAALDHVLVDDEPTRDEWGVWLSGYAPFYRSDGRMEGILGMDISAARVLARERRFLWTGLTILAGTIPTVLVVGFWFGRSLAAPIVALTRGSECIAGGDLSQRVDVVRRDEIGQLARSFNRMTETLQEAIGQRDRELASRRRAEDALHILNLDLQASVQRLSQANEELRRFAFITSHDLKTPLRGIRMLVDWIGADHADQLDATGREYVALLAQRTTRMCNLVEAIHQYVSVGYEGSRTTVDLRELVPEVVKRLHPPRDVQIRIADPLPQVQYDKYHMTQVFEHLLGNALKYADKPHACIVIRCSEEADSWRLSVTDNGPGIDKKYHRKVFEVFQTLAPKDECETAGMGLSIVRKIVESYGGTVWIESVLGEGTTVLFTLPKQLRANLAAPASVAVTAHTFP